MSGLASNPLPAGGADGAEHVALVVLLGEDDAVGLAAAVDAVGEVEALDLVGHAGARAGDEGGGNGATSTWRAG